MNGNNNAHKRGESALAAKGLVKRFKTGRTFIEVLKGVDFDARHGDVTMVMGPSGSGKSTLVAALSGLLMPDEGKVSALEAKDLWSLPKGKIDKFRLDHCGFIFQGFNLFPALTAKQQVMTVLKYQDVSPGEASRRRTDLGPRRQERRDRDQAAARRRHRTRRGGDLRDPRPAARGLCRPRHPHRRRPDPGRRA
jgi:putative ABC transport system ATP-binding protein